MPRVIKIHKKASSMMCLLSNLNSLASLPSRVGAIMQALATIIIPFICFEPRAKAMAE